MTTHLRIAALCGAIPLCTGIGIFVLWLVTRDFVLELLGFLTIVVGLGLFLIGAVALAIACWSRLRHRSADPAYRRFPLRALACAALLLANFPAAYGIIVAVSDVQHDFRVVVRNISNRPLEGVRVVGGGCDMSFGTIPSGVVETRYCRVQHSDAVVFFATRGSETLSKILLQDHGGFGGRVTVTVDFDGWVYIEDRLTTAVPD